MTGHYPQFGNGYPHTVSHCVFYNFITNDDEFLRRYIGKDIRLILFVYAMYKHHVAPEVSARQTSSLRSNILLGWESHHCTCSHQGNRPSSWVNYLVPFGQSFPAVHLFVAGSHYEAQVFLHTIPRARFRRKAILLSQLPGCWFWFVCPLDSAPYWPTDSSWPRLELAVGRCLRGLQSDR